MKKLIIFLLFVLSACVTTTNQPTERIKEENIYPISIPIQLSYKPAKIDFTMNIKVEKQEQRYNGTTEVSQFGESLMWRTRVNLNPRVFIEIKCLTDVSGNPKECDSPIVNIPLKPEERKEIDKLAEGLKIAVGFLGAPFPLPDKPFVSGEELFNISEINIKGIVKGQGFVNNRKVVIVDVSGSANNSSDNQGISEGYILYDLETAHVVKSEISIQGSMGEPISFDDWIKMSQSELDADTVMIKMSYKTTITPLLRSQTSATPQDNAILKKSLAFDVTGMSTVTDIDGNVYQTVKIGNQVWTLENLRTTKYNDGTPIPLVTDKAAWGALTTPGYCYYNNTTNADSIKKYGALYNWYAVGTKKLAPKGWHVPTDAEWDTLRNYLIANRYNWDGTTTGNKITKSMAAKTDWKTDTDSGAIGNNLSKNNKSGFSALPGGSRDSFGLFDSIGSNGYWWSATERDASYAFYRFLIFDYVHLLGTISIKSCGLSVRLLRD